MWILKGLLVCVVIMGMSEYARANSFKAEWKKYTTKLTQSMKEWKNESKLEKKELLKKFYEKQKEAKSQLNQKLAEIENNFQTDIQKLSKEMKFKSKKFQLKSDLALIRSIKMKRKYFNQKLELEKIFLEKSYQTSLEKHKELKKLTYEQLTQQRELLTNMQLSAYFSSDEITKISQKKTCQIQKYFKKKQDFQDYFFSKYERVAPVEVEANYYSEKRALLQKEESFLTELKAALEIMIEQIGKTPKEFRRVERQLKQASKKLVEVSKISEEKINQFGFFKQGLKSAHLKRKSSFVCNPLVKASMRTPEVINEHDRVGEL